ncbi:MAG: multicopper oxidase domain-containing protein [Crocinitomicaceae bacterium]
MRNLFTIAFLLCSWISFGQTSHDIWMQSRMTGLIYLDDGSTTEFWGFGLYNPPTPGPQMSLPGPLLRYNEGDTIRVHFYNNSPEDHTIHWHGLDVDQDNDGVPTTSSVVDPDSLRVYTFVLSNAGTYNYHCHVFTTLHLTMGMYGMFIVDPDSNQNRIYTGGPTYTKDYNWLASEVNRNWSDNPISPGFLYLYEATNLLLNGKEGSQLQNGLFDVTGTTNDTIAMRLSNMGYGKVRYIFPSEANAEIHMSDGRAIPSVIVSDTVDVYSGERFTALLDPNTEFTGNITIEYYDVRDNSLNGTNSVPMIIDNVGIEDLDADYGFDLYPNPVNEYMTIEITDPDTKELIIYDLTGKFIQKVKVQLGTNIIYTDLQRGTYLIGKKSSSAKARFIKL